MTSAPDDTLDSLFHGCAFSAFVEEARKAGGWPDSRAVKRRAYELYEEELAKRNRPTGGQVAP